jgi:hypothetical protein
MRLKMINEIKVTAAAFFCLLGLQINSARADDWWLSQPIAEYCPASSNYPALSANIRGLHHDILEIIYKVPDGSIRDYGDDILNGYMGCPVFSGPTLVVISGTGTPTTEQPYGNRDTYDMYAVKSDLTISVAHPQDTHVFPNGDVVVTPGEAGGGFRIRIKRRSTIFCWRNDDWVQGVERPRCDPKSHSQLIALRTPTAQSITVIREPYYGGARR